jgi:hypothetical protein
MAQGRRRRGTDPPDWAGAPAPSVSLASLGCHARLVLLQSPRARLKGGGHGVAALARMEEATPSRRLHSRPGRRSGPRWFSAVAPGAGRPARVAPRHACCTSADSTFCGGGSPRAGVALGVRSLAFARSPDIVSRDARRPVGWEVPTRAMLHEPVSQRSGVAGQLTASKQTRHGGPAPSQGPRANSRAVTGR